MESVRLVIPSKGELEEPTLSFLAEAGLAVDRVSPRQYVAKIGAVEGLEVLFQRAWDIPEKVASGTADLGITGYDVVAEQAADTPDLVVAMPNLGYGRGDLVVAVPDVWVDVRSMRDLAEVAVEFRARGQVLRVVTRYPRLTQRFLLANGIGHFTLVAAQGAIEAAPAIGYGDIVADLTSSGTTLRENHLKTIAGGTILRTEACLIANRRRLKANPDRLEVVRRFLELIEARLRAAGFYSVTGNVPGDSAESVAQAVISRPELSGIEGPTVSPVYSKSGPVNGWYAVTVVVPVRQMQAAVDHLRRLGGSGITVIPIKYVFEPGCEAFERLTKTLAQD
ncbi:MAG: ATP phosphoribosyltransferase [Chloroflexota bacterium]